MCHYLQGVKAQSFENKDLACLPSANGSIETIGVSAELSTRLSPESVPQPYYDFEMARICAWLKKHGLTAHVSLAGKVELRPRSVLP